MSLVVSDQAGSFGGESVERVSNERVHNGHGLLGDSSFRVDLFEHLVHIDAERFNSLLGSLLFNSLDVFGSGGGFFGSHFI